MRMCINEGRHDKSAAHIDRDMTDGLGKSFPVRFMNVGGERTEASAMMTQILLSPIFRASDFTVNVKKLFAALQPASEDFSTVEMRNSI